MEHLFLKEDLSEKELLIIQDEVDYERMDEILEYLYMLFEIEYVVN